LLRKFLQPQWFMLLVCLGTMASVVLLWQGLLAQERRQIREKVTVGGDSIGRALVRDFQTRLTALQGYGEASAGRDQGAAVNVRLSEANLFLALFQDYRTVAWVDPSLDVRWVASRKGEGITGARIAAFSQGQIALLQAARDTRGSVVAPARNRDDDSRQFAIYLPIYTGQGFRGYIFGLLDVGAFLAVAIPEHRFPGLSAVVFDGIDELFRLHDRADELPEQWRQRREVALNDNVWRLDVWPTQTLIDRTRTVLPLAALVTGMLLTALIALANYFQDQVSRERKRAERKLAEREQRLRGVIDNVADAIVTIRESSAIESFNAAAESIFGYSAEEARGTDIRELLPGPFGTLSGDEGDGAEGASGEEPDGWARTVAASPHETMGRRKDGSEVPIDLSISEMWVGEERLFIGIARDISERKETEAQLQQAQKMEAVGQLTGGVAHDFNNLLTVILGNLRLLEQRLADDRRLSKWVDTASRAALRGADLTKRLLAFSRRQILEPKVLDLNKLVGDVDLLLRRSLGATVDMKFAFADDLWLTKVDPGQLENALLNLVINARDAMPDGGTLTIETANARLDEAYASRQADVEAGEYVLLMVSDVGTGMSKELRKRVFEPFFTTKETGKGTGLGLSMVYGFVKQSGGHAAIYSEIGLGTTVRLYFPRSGAAAPSAERQPDQEMPTGEERILVVEDDPDVRETGVTFLEELGYSVLEAENGPAALVVLEEHDDIDMLFTDVVMPGGMNGPALAEVAQNGRPGLKVLYASGYTRDAVFRDKMLDESTELLPKPYLKEELASKVREILDR
jgi:PAS domain S-box-containing protein